MTNPQTEQFRVDVVVVGAGFAGLYALHLLRGSGFSTMAFEAGDSVGGTWYWNRYPGARCDVESVDYSFSFSPELEQEWEWTEKYASQPEIHAYLNHVADRFDLRRDIVLNTRVISATFDEDASLWTVETDTGRSVRAQYVVLGTGCLSTPRAPEIPGLDSFAGQTYHTAHWPHEGVDFTAKRLAVIGTGSSGVQLLPLVADQAAEVVLIQRTPTFQVPARNTPMDPEYFAQVKAHYRNRRAFSRTTFGGSANETQPISALEVSEEEREAEYEARWAAGGTAFMQAYRDIMTDPAANSTAADFVRKKIETIVEDKDVAKKLQPTSYALGAKRICIGTDYYESFNRPNVRLVAIEGDGIERVTPGGIVVDRVEYLVDAIVFATGFDAMTGSILAIEITGRDGAHIAQAWADGPRTYMGLMTAGFPNMFIVTGPGSPAVLSNMVASIEQEVEWIDQCLRDLRAQGATSMEATPDSQERWMTHVTELANQTLFVTADSWYVGANVPGKPRGFMAYTGGVGPFGEEIRRVAAAGYEGFRITAPTGESR